MTAALPSSTLDAFALAAGELGMYSAARLFCDELLAEGGAELVGALRDLVGPSFPVLDVVASRILAAERLPSPSAEEVLRELSGVGRVVIVGAEAVVVDALLEGLAPSVRIGVVLDTTLAGDARRIATNFEERAEVCALDEVIHWAGSRTALVTAVYGSDDHRVIVSPVWLRLMGPDTRTCFGGLVGWNLLGGAMDVYPRWLRESLASEFTAIVPHVS